MYKYNIIDGRRYAYNHCNVATRPPTEFSKYSCSVLIQIFSSDIRIIRLKPIIGYDVLRSINSLRHHSYNKHLIGSDSGFPAKLHFNIVNSLLMF